MKRLITWIRLFRPKHYIKNLLIFVPLFFSASFGKSLEQLGRLFMAFSAFCFVSSLVYIVNDIKDREADRLHEIKCKRPIASGEISAGSAAAAAFILAAAAFFLNWSAAGSPLNAELIFLILYFGLNAAYSFKLKHIPIIDVMILASGFLIRTLYGAEISGTKASDWLILTIIAISLYMGFGKRRNEIIKQNGRFQTREVLKQYTCSFCDKMMNVCMTLGIAFYSLWAISVTYSDLLIWSVIPVIFICMKYTLAVEGNSFGDPVDVLLGDKILIASVLFYVIYMYLVIYII